MAHTYKCSTQETQEFQAGMNYIVRASLKKNMVWGLYVFIHLCHLGMIWLKVTEPWLTLKE